MSAEYIVFIIGVIVRITSTTMLQQYAVGRLVSGLGRRRCPWCSCAHGLYASNVRTYLLRRLQYQTETAPSQIHGTLTCVVHDLSKDIDSPDVSAIYQLFITFGINILVACQSDFASVFYFRYSKRLVDCISTGTKYIPDSVSWRIPVGIGILWVLILGISILFMPESPRMFSACSSPIFV